MSIGSERPEKAPGIARRTRHPRERIHEKLDPKEVRARQRQLKKARLIERDGFVTLYVTPNAR